MALRKLDKPDYYGTANVADVWDVVVSDTVESGGRFTGNRHTFAAGSYVEALIDAQGTWIVGFAVRFLTLPSATTNGFLKILDDSSIQTDVRLTPTGTIQVTRNGTVLGTSTAALKANVWYYIEYKTVIHNSTGSFNVKVDGSSKVSGSSQDTQNTSNATANRIRIGENGSVNSHLDDVYICDGTGSQNNDFLGETRVGTLLPDGAGTTTQWTPSAGSNFQNVDETTPDGDTTYNSSQTAGQIDLYTFSNTTLTGTVAGLSINMYARKDDAGTREIRALTRRGGSNYNGATKSLASSFQYHVEIQELDPSTSAAWTITNLNAAEFGVEVVT